MEMDDIEETYRCPICRGNGRISPGGNVLNGIRPCHACHGKGFIRKRRRGHEEMGASLHGVEIPACGEVH